ncbi:threonine synthase [Pseudomonas sp. 10B1]|uniref:threonine synthase n=1 Tax=unclassified Pseudomonas TaxID=196821 RepID=UPI002AB3B931|nr:MULTISPECIES: threonine synthase [unclassified Pseudomonas]MDY7559274.1 threonine synthase [Pseudomonas sp. AB6]MEA9979327.1 threonine synthase [Pseudomonas sp. RTS4]MEA9994132.1 threonine synthase [Pseudomonas sp. AA4]MEB0086233.1 threonine synthase [Pseudomonas sp. RTI1]MEB0125021.1 threonine synthase [Pseudomonas sp. CCC1.2]
MRYISTRGQAPALNFEDVLLTGLASDGGLYVPENLPRFTQEEIASWAGLAYHELAFRVMRPFVSGSIPDADFKKILEETYSSGENGVFAHGGIAPLRPLNGNEWVLELFHGPTLAFKDFALQLLGRLLDYVLAKRGERVVILGATSGDTGSAAIEGCRRCDNVDIFILHPNKRVSEVQRRQMTTIAGENIHNIAIEGNFDDCQEMVKASFADQGFLKGTRLVAVNSINWARIMAQIVYYFHAALQLGGPARSVAFSVPTGNFGDIFAGYLARNMGLPISQLIVATNRNDILHRFMSGNQYTKETLHATLSPSMDIMVSSNFERLLFDMHGRNGASIAGLMDTFKQSGAFSVDAERWTETRKLFDSLAVSDEETCETIAEVFANTGEVLDPHTAIGVKAARDCRRSLDTPMVILGTAHPVKFPEAVDKAGVGKALELPAHLSDLFVREEKYTVLPNDLKAVHDFVAQHGNRGAPL